MTKTDIVSKYAENEQEAEKVWKAFFLALDIHNKHFVIEKSRLECAEEACKELNVDEFWINFIADWLWEPD